jgi:hypothetical protein
MYSTNGNFMKNCYIIEKMTGTGIPPSQQLPPGPTLANNNSNSSGRPSSQPDPTFANNNNNNNSSGRPSSQQIYYYRPPPGTLIRRDHTGNLLITSIVTESNKIYNVNETISFMSLSNESDLLNKLDNIRLKEIIEINIYFNIYTPIDNNTTSTPHYDTPIIVKTNKQVTFEYNIDNDKYLNNVTKITFGNDDLSIIGTEYEFKIPKIPNKLIRCKITVMPNINSQTDKTKNLPVFIINNLKSAINEAGRLV